MPFPSLYNSDFDSTTIRICIVKSVAITSDKRKQSKTALKLAFVFFLVLLCDGADMVFAFTSQSQAKFGLTNVQAGAGQLVIVVAIGGFLVAGPVTALDGYA